MKKEFEARVSPPKRNVYNLLYDKEKAKTLYDECTLKFKEDFEAKWGENGSEPKNLKKILIKMVVGLLLTAVCCISLIWSIVSSPFWWLCFLFAVAGLLSFGFTVFCGMNAKELFEDIDYHNERYKNNAGPYEYPLLVQFHQIVGDNEIVGISVRGNNRTDIARTLGVSYKTPDGEQERKTFCISKVVSCDVTQIEIDLENDIIRYPSKAKKSDFLINGRKDDCE